MSNQKQLALANAQSIQEYCDAELLAYFPATAQPIGHGQNSATHVIAILMQDVRFVQPNAIELWTAGASRVSKVDDTITIDDIAMRCVAKLHREAAN